MVTCVNVFVDAVVYITANAPAVDSSTANVNNVLNTMGG